jgi:F-type H+-transporting ATPase subunit b
LQIDWITVAAQIVNFLVLVWLLQRFLYRPITQAMRRRETKIEDRLSEARSAREEAEAEAERLRRKQVELDEERDDILNEARAEATDLRERLEQQIRAEMEEKRETWKRHLEEEREEFGRVLQRRAGREVLEIAGGVLSEFADADLTERIARTFASRLESLDGEARDRLAQAAGHAREATVETARALDSTTRGIVTRALHEALSTSIPVAYQQNEDVTLGVRVTIGEQSLDWSSDHHLKRLEAALDEIVDSATRGAPGAGDSDARASA